MGGFQSACHLATSIRELLVHVSVLSWNRRVWRLAGPIMISNVSVPLMGAVDTAVVGHLPGPQYIGAVAIGVMVFNILYWCCAFLRMGTTGLTAQALGAGDGDEVRAALGRPLIMGTTIGIAMIALQLPLTAIAFAAFGASEAVDPLARAYFAVRIWAAPASLANFALIGWFVGVQRARSVMILQLTMNAINAGLDFGLVFGLDFGVTGVAWANVCAQYTGTAIGLWQVARCLRRIPGIWKWTLLRRADRIQTLLRINRDIFLRTLCMTGSMAVFTAIGARGGDAVLAVNAILFQMHTIISQWLDGFSHTAGTLVGSAIGARDRATVRKAVTVTGGWAVGVAASASIFYAFFGGAVVDLITDIPEARLLAREYLPWIVFGPVYAVWSYLLDGIFTGATRTADMRNTAMLSSLVFLACAAVLVPWLGNHGLWLSYFIFMLTRATSLAVLYPRLERSVPDGPPPTAKVL